MTDDQKSKFCVMVTSSFSGGRFARLVLSAPRDKAGSLQKILVRETAIKGTRKLSFTYRYKTRDEVKNYDLGEAENLIAAALEKDFKAANLFTLDFDCAYPSLKKTKASLQEKPDTAHDRSFGIITKERNKCPDQKRTDFFQSNRRPSPTTNWRKSWPQRCATTSAKAPPRSSRSVN